MTRRSNKRIRKKKTKALHQWAQEQTQKIMRDWRKQGFGTYLPSGKNGTVLVDPSDPEQRKLISNDPSERPE